MTEQTTAPPSEYTLWHRERPGQRWQPVASAGSERELFARIDVDDRRDGEWIVLPVGHEP